MLCTPEYYAVCKDLIAETIEWYVSHRPWWEAIRSGEFRHYYERMYGAR